MKLFNLVKLIKTLCLNQPNVNTFFEGDIYDLNHKQDIDYSVMVLTHQTHDISVDAEYESFGCNLFYVDRLTSDGDNRLDVQSHAITVLEGIINELENQGFYIERVTINEFTERFDAECAGAYAQVRIRANSNCCCNDYKIVTSVNGMRGDVILDIETGTTVDQFARDLAEEALEKANEALSKEVDAYTKEESDEKYQDKLNYYKEYADDKYAHIQIPSGGQVIVDDSKAEISYLNKGVIVQEDGVKIYDRWNQDKIAGENWVQGLLDNKQDKLNTYVEDTGMHITEVWSNPQGYTDKSYLALTPMALGLGYEWWNNENKNSVNELHINADGAFIRHTDNTGDSPIYEQEKIVTEESLKTINGESIVGKGNIVITGETPDLKHYSEGTAFASMNVEDNTFILGDENLFITRKYGDKESQISMKDEGIRLTTNGSVLINGKEAATLNDIKNQMNNLTVIEYPSFENGFYNYGWIRTVKRNQGVGFVGSDGVGLTLVTKEVMEGEDKVQTLKQYFIDNENNDIKVRTATLRTYADGATWFEKGAWSKLNDTYTQGQGITIDPTTKTISSNIDIADYYTKEQSDGKYALKGDIPEPYDDGELRGRIESLEGSETAFTSDITALSGSVGTLSTQMENKADKSEIPSLDGYATEAWVEDKGYLTEHQQLKTINGQSLLGEGDIEVGGGASGNYLPLTGGTLTGRLQVGNSSNNNITNAFLHQRYANNTWNGACFAINSDGTASFQHKLYSENFGSARNDAILRFSGAGLQFGVAASGNVGESDYKKVLLEGDVTPYDDTAIKNRLSAIEAQLNGLDEALNNILQMI